MCTRLAFILLLLIALPAMGTVTEPSTGIVQITTNGPAKFATGACYLILGDQNCSGAVQGKSFVSLNICTQQESDDGDAVATQLCNAAQVAAGRCPVEWQDAVTMVAPGACAKLLDAWTKGVLKSVGQNGMKKLEATRAPAAGDPDGEFGDP